MCQEFSEEVRGMLAALVDAQLRTARTLERIADALERSDERNDSLLNEFRPFLNFGKQKLSEQIVKETFGE